MSVTQIVEQAHELAAILDAPSHDVQKLADAMGRVGALRRLVDGVGVDLAGQFEALAQRDPEGVRALGERSPVMVVRSYVGLDITEAFAWCRVGEAIQPQSNLQGEVLPARHEALVDAMGTGAMRVLGAAQVLETLDEIAPYSSPAERVEVERFLVDTAPELTDRQFTRVCRSMLSRFNPDGAAPREEELRDKRGLVKRRTREGLAQWVLTLDPESEGFLSTGVDARTAPRRLPTFSDPTQPIPDGDDRTLRQRQLDALVSIARESLAHDTGRLAGTAVTVSVSVTLDALRTGLGTAKIAGVDEPISAATARRLAADAAIIPVVLGSESEPLDMGRAVRLATEPQRRALEIRDQGCIWWSCTAPPGWCEVAHIEPWASGGATDLDNMMLLCAFHHRCFDNDGWRLEARDGERYLIPPPWVDPAQTPRRAGPLPVMRAA